MLTAEVARSSILLMRRVTGESSIRRRPSNVVRVRRVLFDEPLNHEETRRDLLRETEKLSTEMRHRWNFDFETETPLEGRYEWQRTSGTVHPAYELRNLTARLSAPTSTMVSGSASSDSSVSTELKSAVNNSTTPSSSSSSTKNKTTVQKKVTDFMTQRKRPLLKPATSPAQSPKNKVRRTTTTT